MLIDHVVFYEKLKNEIVQSENSNIEISELSDAEQTTLENDPENALLVITLISACECSKGTHSPSLLYIFTGTIGAFTHKNLHQPQVHIASQTTNNLYCVKSVFTWRLR